MRAENYATVTHTDPVDLRLEDLESAQAAERLQLRLAEQEDRLGAVPQAAHHLGARQLRGAAVVVGGARPLRRALLGRAALLAQAEALPVLLRVAGGQVTTLEVLLVWCLQRSLIHYRYLSAKTQFMLIAECY